MNLASSDLGPVQRIGVYTVERLLGHGGSGEVYSVRGPGHPRSVALKLLPRAIMESRPDLVPAFQREYHRLQLLRHPRIVESYDYGSTEAGLYYTMELVEGPDLKAVVPLAWRQTCSLLRDVALSLAIVHSRRLLHRDVGPGNVRCTRDGRAKLIDFGAVVSMGIPSSVVGTPPCIPPEAIDHQALDARSDLYGLGALGYFLLTGEHAYPATGISQLPAAWELAPARPSLRAPGVPEALDRLILSLLQLDRRLRPGSAIEVIHHLEALAELAPVAASEAAQSSLVAPALAGRTAELDLLARSLASARQRQGSGILIEAEPGLGRTRLLNQFVVEASQRDVLVAAVYPGRASALGHDGCLSLCEAILRQLPLRSDGLMDQHNATLSALFGRLQCAPGQIAGEAHDAPSSSRAVLLSELHAALLALGEQVTLVVLVDDLQLCDEASAALFADLAASAHEHRLLVVATRQSGAHVVAAHAVQRMSQHACRVLLRPLELQSVEELVRSTFVGAPQVKRVAEWAVALSDGNPRKVVDLLRHLVEHDVVRFSEGAWFLPDQIATSALPGAMAEALRARIDSLSSSAREVAELVCVSAYPLDIESLRELLAAAGGAPNPDERLLNALDELAAAGVVTSDEGRYVIASPALSEALFQGMSAERLCRTHLRLGRTFCAGLSLDYDAKVNLWSAFLWSLAGYHLMRAGESKLGAELWDHALRYSMQVDVVAMWDGGKWFREGNLLAIDAAEKLGMPALMLARLRVGLVQAAVHCDPRMVVHGERAIEELEIAAGARDYDACAHVADAGARLKTALGMALARWRSTPETAQGISPFEALPLLVAGVFSTASIYFHTLETTKLAKLSGKLDPFASLSISVSVLRDLVEAIVAGTIGRTEDDLRLRLRSLDGLVAMETQAGTSLTGLRHIRGFTLYFIACIEAVRNPERGLRRIEQLESEASFMQYGAWQARLIAQIYACNASEATACSERMEMVAVQAGATKSQLHHCGLLYLAEAYALTGDVMGLRATIDKLQPIAERLVDWQPQYDAARAQYQRLCGQLGEARVLAERAASKLVPGLHRGYCFVIVTLLSVLLDLEEPRRALTFQREALTCARDHALGPETEAQFLKLGALAEAALGDLASARVQIDAAIAVAHAADFAGALLGDLQLCAARLALSESDRGRFQEHAAQVAQHTCAHDHPYMIARYERLLADAERAGFAASVVQSRGRRDEPATQLTAQRALELVLAKTGAKEGFLFGMIDQELQLLAAVGQQAPLGLHDAVRGCFAAERVSGGAMNTLTATLTTVIRAENGRLFQTAVLNMVDEHGALQTSGALAISVHDDVTTMPRWDDLSALASVVVTAAGQPTAKRLRS